MNFFRIAAVVSLLLGVISCADSKVSYNYPNNNQSTQRRAKNTGKFMSSSWLPFSAEKKSEEKEGGIPQSEKLDLWQTSAQVIGAMFPISIIDEKSGIIATEWHQENPQSNIRIKINVLVRQADTLDESIRVSVFQQERKSENSSWQGSGLHSPKSVEKSAMKAQKIKDEILKRIAPVNENKIKDE